MKHSFQGKTVIELFIFERLQDGAPFFYSFQQSQLRIMLNAFPDGAAGCSAFFRQFQFTGNHIVCGEPGIDRIVLKLVKKLLVHKCLPV